MSEGRGQQARRRTPTAPTPGLGLTVRERRPSGVGVGHGAVDLTVGDVETGAGLGVLLHLVQDHVQGDLVVLLLSYHCHHSLRQRRICRFLRELDKSSTLFFDQLNGGAAFPDDHSCCGVGNDHLDLLLPLGSYLEITMLKTLGILDTLSSEYLYHSFRIRGFYF